jgi:ATP-binding cassette subfamily B protein
LLPRGEIEFRNLSFTYPTTLSGGNGPNGAGKSNGSAPRHVLSDIDLKIPAGSTVAIVGPTGCGKTTLAALVARLWEAADGCVLIDGHPIRQWPL